VYGTEVPQRYYKRYLKLEALFDDRRYLKTVEALFERYLTLSIFK
jgi:hypothetical protein